MRVVMIAVMMLVCLMQVACVTQRETLPPETRAELLRLGRIITDENEAEETRSKSQIRYCKLIWEAMEKYGKKSVDWQTVVDSFVVDGRRPKGLTLDDWTLDYGFERKDGKIPSITIYAGGWTGSYVWKAYLSTGIP